MAIPSISSRKSVALAVLTVLLCGVTGAALAGTATSNFAVSTTVAANCTIDASAGLSFGSYDPVSANTTTALTGTGTISTTCTNGSSAIITLGQGGTTDATSSDASPLREMSDGTDTLTYNLYTDSAYTTVWGNTSTTGKGITGTGTASSTTVYGKIAAGQNVGTGSYTDTVIATVTF